MEEENARLKEQVAQYAQKEASTKEVFEQMKTRLKDALDEKRDFEIEYLQLQKNYIKLKNAPPPAQERSKEDSDKLNRLIAE